MEMRQHAENKLTAFEIDAINAGIPAQVAMKRGCRTTHLLHLQHPHLNLLLARKPLGAQYWREKKQMFAKILFHHIQRLLDEAIVVRGRFLTEEVSTQLALFGTSAAS
jgi:hypothetical protein